MIPLPLRPIIKKWHNCQKCPLHLTRHEMVYYRGEMPCDVLFLGEAPGKDEDLYGEPFIGRAGQLLDHWIEDCQNELQEMSSLTPNTFDPFTYGITNIVSCIPLDEERKIRQPSKEEAHACNGRLLATIRAAQPKVIILLGAVAKKYYKIAPDLADIPVIELQHPAYVLRQGGVGSYAYDSNLLKLQESLEEILYGTQEAKQSNKERLPQQKKKVRKPSAKGSGKNQTVKVRSDRTGTGKSPTKRVLRKKRPT